MKKVIMEILCNGKVHYRRPAGHGDVKEVEELIRNGQAPSYSVRQQIKPEDNPPEKRKK